jgi:hypothetical protein
MFILAALTSHFHHDFVAAAGDFGNNLLAGWPKE